MRKILVLDNYDSFTFNLVHYIESIVNYNVDVFKNDEISISDVNKYDKIILSPGPGLPENAGILKELIKTYASSKNIFGVCLGMQAMAEVFGGELINLNNVFHGINSQMNIVDYEEPLFKGVPTQFEGGRYHSWVVKKENLPSCLKITVFDNEGLIMGLRHEKFNIRGVQFHPESILTQFGNDIIANWLTNT